MKLIARNTSVVTGKKNLEHLITYTKFPVFIGCTDKPRKQDFLTDMSFSICRDSGMIQLDRLIPLDILYAEYHSEAVGGVWREHHEKFVAFVSQFSPKDVLEIGGSNCFIAERYVGKKKGVRWTIVEPNPVKSKNPNIRVIPKLFDGHFRIKGAIDAVVHSHVLEHMYDPDTFLKNVNGLLAEEQLHVFSVPHLEKYLENGQSNCVNFEHTLFLTEYFIDWFLAKNGFVIVEKRYFHEHSIFYATRKSVKTAPVRLVSRYKEYKKRFVRYVNDNRKIVRDINRKIARAEKPAYLFGAHVFSQLLLNLGLDAKRIQSVLDNSKIKQGKRLYGTGLMVASPDILKGEKNPVVILRIGAYQKEIRDQIRNINKTAVCIE